MSLYRQIARDFVKGNSMQDNDIQVRRDEILAETQADWDEFKRFTAAVEAELAELDGDGA